ncbi:MAG TPA: crossover junction endodeoxyribonuclease RuvC [Candidatus Paceibacterota bacterium]|nr:crossover junction endodeoxyribonuclease RuvC [Candidatus Paceibacterota bacterium]
MPRKDRRVLSFDPGFERLGAAVVEQKSGKDTLVHSECVRTKATLDFPDRLALLGDAVERLLHEYEPDAVALEEVFFERNVSTAIQIGSVMGVITYLARQHGLPIYQYTPLEVKVATTGYGKSDKRAVAAMVGRLVVLPAKKRLDDELDAIAVGLTCLASERA